MEKIMAPILQTPNNRVKLLIISTEFLFRVAEFLSKERNGSAFLTKNAPNTESRRVALDLEGQLKVR
jgi:hypothetical protein